MPTKIAEAYVSVRANTAALIGDMNAARGVTQASATQMGAALPAGIAPGTAAARAQIATIPASAKAAAAQVQASAGVMGGSFAAMAKSMAGAMGVMAAGAGLVGGMRAAVGFEQALINATAGMTGAEDAMGELEATAREWGITAGVGAEKAADALGYLALAGYDANQSMAALPTIMKFAGAGAFDAATASDILTDAVSALGDSVGPGLDNLEKMKLVADQLAMASITANTSVEEMGQAILMKAGAAAKEAKMPMQDLNLMLLMFADQGRKGSEGGTLAAATIAGLTKQAAKFADTPLNDIIFDQAGGMRSLADIVSGLTKEYGHLSKEERTKLLLDLGINRQAADGVNLLMNQEEAVKKYTAALDGSGGAVDDLANKKWAGLEQRLGVMKAQMVDFAISALLPLTRMLIEMMEPVMSAVVAFGRWFEGLGTLIPRMAAVTAAVTAVRVAIPYLVSGIMLVSKALTKAMFSNPFTAVLTGIMIFIMHLKEAAAEGAEWAQPFIKYGTLIWEKMQELWIKVKELAAVLMEKMLPIWTMIKDAAMAVFNALAEAVGMFFEMMDSNVSGTRTGWETAFEIMGNVARGVIAAVTAIFNVMKSVFDTVVNAMAEMWDWMFGTSFAESIGGAWQIFMNWIGSVLDILSLLSTDWGLTWELIKEYSWMWLMKIWNVVANVFELIGIGALALLGTFIGVWKGIYNTVKYWIGSAWAYTKATFAGMIAVAKEAWAKITGSGSGKSLASTFKDEFNQTLQDTMPDEPDKFTDTVKDEIANWTGDAVSSHKKNKAAREQKVEDSKRRQAEIVGEMEEARRKKRQMEDLANQKKKGIEEEKEAQEEADQEVAEKKAEAVKKEIDKISPDIGFKGVKEFGRAIQEALVKEGDKKRDDQQAADIHGIKALQERNNEIQNQQLQEMKKDKGGGALT